METVVDSWELREAKSLRLEVANRARLLDAMIDKWEREDRPFLATSDLVDAQKLIEFTEENHRRTRDILNEKISMAERLERQHALKSNPQPTFWQKVKKLFSRGL